MSNFDNEQCRRLSAWRWVLLLILSAACVPAALHLGSASEALIPITVSIASCALLLRYLDTFTSRNVTVWLALCLFLILYFLRYAYLAFDPTPIAKTLPGTVYGLLQTDREGLQWSFVFSAIAFSVFCVFSALFLRRVQVKANVGQVASENSYRTADLRIARMLLLGIPILMLLLGYVAHVYKIGQMGLPPGEPLPFRLKGVIFHARLIVLPLLILTLIYLGTKTKSSWMERAGLFLLLVHGVSDMMLRGSRSSLLLCILLAIFLAASGGLKLKRNGMLIGSALLLASIWLMPVIMKYRILRFTSTEGPLAVMVEAINATGDSLTQLLLVGLSVVYFRIPGIETMWAIHSVKAEPLGSALIPTLATPFGLTGYLNFAAYHLPPELNTLFAPGFVGWLYLAGGMIGLLLGSIALASVCVMVPRLCFDSGLRCAPVANTFLLWMLFVSISDGTLDGNLFMIAVGLFSLGAIELSLRMSRISPVEPLR